MACSPRRAAVSLSADQTLFLSGEEGDGCYRIDEGLLKASVTEPGGGERILAMLGPGSVVGELSMIDGVPRSASIIALRDSKLSFISRTAFHMRTAKQLGLTVPIQLLGRADEIIE
jgi:CRP/FNR family transcriptional regulator, cyclic AMP receptor protein